MIAVMRQLERTCRWALASSLVMAGMALWPASSFSAEPAGGADAGVPAATCEQCHAGLTSRKHVHSALSSGACTDCHAAAARPTACKAPGVTGWKLTKPDPELCAECHDKSGETPPHQVIGLRGCTACHDPHGADHEQNLKLPVPALCQECHRPVDTGSAIHGPVEEGKCLACHEPHAGVTAPLLREERKDLCAQCHEAADLSSLHRQAKKTCLDCHAPHASDRPTLLRPPRDADEPKALGGPSYDAESCAPCHGELTSRKFQHSFFGSGTCADCHVAVDTRGKCKQPVKKGWRLARPEPQLCTECHDKSGDTPMHKAVDLGGCTACHDPHGASLENLLKASGGELCQRCHRRKDDRAHPHTAVKEGKCTGCHEAHAGVTAPLLREERKDLCAKCHPPDQLLPDPEKHPPVTQNRCLECHDPHGSDQPNALLAKGRDLCLKCHAQDSRTPGGEAAATRQLDLSLSSTHNPVSNDDCQTCHVQTHSGKLKQLLVEPPLALCVQCHDVSGNTPLHRAVEAGGCVACHLPHSSQNRSLLKAWPQDKLCYSCHDRKDAQANPHTPVKQGECLGCHAPHAGEAAPLLITPRTALCAECHETQNLVLSPEVHAPVAEGRCLDCHAPHGSANAYNLRAAAGSSLCLTCHDAAKPNRTVLPGKQLNLARANVHAPLNKEGCQACHEVGHSADVKMLLRQRPPNLCYGCHERQDARTYTHGAVQLGDCPVCHSPHTSDNPKLLQEVQESKACFRCHQDDLTGRAFLHKPAAEGKCSQCHDPHGASSPFNLSKVSNPRESCAKCHELSEPVTVKHLPLERYGCVACHDPHGTANKFQLLKPVNELCQGCHPEQADGLHITTFVASGHVVAESLDPRREGRAFTCASCHNPHGANNPKLFYFGKNNMEMCEGCHGNRSGKHKDLQDVTRSKQARQALQPDGGPPLPPPRYTGPPAGPIVLTRTEGEPGVPPPLQTAPLSFDMPDGGTPAARGPAATEPSASRLPPQATPISR